MHLPGDNDLNGSKDTLLYQQSYFSGVQLASAPVLEVKEVYENLIKTACTFPATTGKIYQYSWYVGSDMLDSGSMTAEEDGMIAFNFEATPNMALTLGVRHHLPTYQHIDYLMQKSCSSSFSRVRQYLVNFSGLAGIVNTAVYKTEPIFAGLRYGKLSQFLTLSHI